MSKRTSSGFPSVFPRIIAVIGVGVAIASSASGQASRVTIQVSAERPARLRLDVNGSSATQLSFVDSYAGLVGLGNRIGKLSAFDRTGGEISVRRLAPGQYTTSAPPARIAYDVEAATQLRPIDAAKTSWVAGDNGVLLLRDLMPVETRSTPLPVRVTLSLPAGWRAYTNGRQLAESEFELADADTAIIAVGRDLRETTKTAGETVVSSVISGSWSFSDAEASDLAGKILKAHRDVFGAAPSPRIQWMLLPFPNPARPDQWVAETRGSTVLLLMGRNPSRVGALAQLSTPLTHELFHTWLPNALALTGDFDWFFEGFTVYQAARTAVKLDLLTFAEFLAAIGHAYDGYLASTDRDRWSLVEASGRRWTTGQTAIYSKSMLIAFLYDLKLRSQTRGKRSLDEIYERLFQNYRATPAARSTNGNDAVKSVLGAQPGMERFVETYVTQPVVIDLEKELAPYGLRLDSSGLRTRINAGDSLTKQQRDLLKQLGYNEIARYRTK